MPKHSVYLQSTKLNMKTEYDKLTEEQEKQIGAEIARVLSLKKKRENGRYETTGGDKTELGLARTIYDIYLKAIGGNAQ